MTGVVLISRSEEYEARMRGLFGKDLTSLVGAFRTFGGGVILHHLDEHAPPGVVFLGPFLTGDSMADLSSHLRERYPAVPIVLVHEHQGGAGRPESAISAVISPIADDASVVALVGRLSGALPAAADAANREETGGEPATGSTGSPGRGQVIAVVAPKGGVGMTTTAANLAVGLSHSAPDEVVLVDGDLQFGDVAATLDLTPAHTLPAMVVGLAPRDPMVLKTLLTAHPAGFYVVCGARSPADGDRVSAEQFGHLLEQLAATFRHVVVDTAPGLGEHALTALDHATDAIVLSAPSVPTLRAVHEELALLERIRAMPSTRHLVLNLVDRSGGLTRKDAETIIGTPIDVIVPRSKAVPLTTNRGLLLLRQHRRDPAARALGRLVARLRVSAAAGDRDRRTSP